MARGKKSAKTAEPQTKTIGNMAVMSADQPREAFPQFYKEPEVLNPETYGSRGLIDKVDFSFASKAHVVPLMCAEFPVAARDYPIVFIGKPALPAAILGIRPNQNVFVDAEGNWAPDIYIPAYIRRYPFIFVRGRTPTEYTLCIDRTTDRLVEEGGKPLFDKEGKTTDTLVRALEFCTTFQQQFMATEKICEILVSEGLLTFKQGKFSFPTGENIALTDFRMVDEERMTGLRDEDFLRLRADGVFATIYCHLISMNNWSALLRRAELAQEAAA